MPRRGIFSFAGHCGSSGRAPLHDPLPVPWDFLIGQCPVVEIHVNGKAVQCVVDTGSQVTLFSEGLCKEIFGMWWLTSKFKGLRFQGRGSSL